MPTPFDVRGPFGPARPGRFPSGTPFVAPPRAFPHLRLPVMSVNGMRPDRSGNIELAIPPRGVESFTQSEVPGEYSELVLTDGAVLRVYNGATGASAYEIAVAAGYDGTPQQWLESLHGRDGTDADAQLQARAAKWQVEDAPAGVDISAVSVDYGNPDGAFESAQWYFSVPGSEPVGTGVTDSDAAGATPLSADGYRAVYGVPSGWVLPGQAGRPLADADAVAAQFHAMRRGFRQVVQSLDSVQAPNPMAIYMVPKSPGQTRNVYDEYIYTASGWEKVGDTELDLSGYKTKQAAVSDPAVPGSGATAALEFIDTISQDADGVIAPTKKRVATTAPADASAAGQVADAFAVKNALAGKASTADATLTARTGFSEWSFSDGNSYTIRVFYEDAGGSYIDTPWVVGIIGMFGGDRYATETEANYALTHTLTKLEFSDGISSAFSATRVALRGYNLGSQTSKPLAGEDEAAELRESKYEKPGSGIPKSDLASPVQTSLSKADTALQSLTVLSYGTSTWADLQAALAKNAVVFCLASSNSNPATGTQSRRAFLAYLTDSEAEFQYFRSMNNHTYAQQSDQIFVYKLTSAGVWSVETRNVNLKIVIDASLNHSESTGTGAAMTISAPIALPWFRSTAPYSVGTRVVYANAIWECTTAVSTPGNWTGAANWTKVFDLLTDATPTANSTKLMTSGAIKTAMDLKASTADATLTPIYSQTPTYSEWTIKRDGVDVTSQVSQPVYEEFYFDSYGWTVVTTPTDPGMPEPPTHVPSPDGQDATQIQWETRYIDDEVHHYIATRTRTDILGYQLGSQSDKPVASEAEAEELREKKYALPSGGIPKSDLASAVQTSLGKADSSVQNTGGTITNGSLTVTQTGLAPRSATLGNTALSFFGGQSGGNNWADPVTYGRDGVQVGNNKTVRFVPDKGGFVTLVENIAPEWESGEDYAQNAIVSYAGGIYLKQTSGTITSYDPPREDTTNWSEVTVEALLAAIRATLAGKASASDLPYSFHAATVGSGATPTVTDLANRAINYATLGSSVTAATVTLPAATTGRSRDFFLDLTIEAADAPTLTFIDPATGTTANVAFGADSLADIAPGYNLALWTELPNNRWLVSVKHEDAT